MARCNETDYAVLKYIWEFQGKYFNSPPVGMIADRIGVTQPSVNYCLGKLQKAGYIDWVYVPPCRFRFIVPLFKR